MNVLISPSIVKSAARIDVDGNVIDKRTKLVIEPNDPGYVPSSEELTGLGTKQEPTAPEIAVVSQTDPMDISSIQKEILGLEARLAHLKELKKAKIEEMKKQLQELEQETI